MGMHLAIPVLLLSVCMSVASATAASSSAASATAASSSAAASAPGRAPLPPADQHYAYLPLAYAPQPTCPVTSTQGYGTIPYDGEPYKNNRLTDQNADFRLSVLGYAPVSAYLGFVTYDGTPHADAPRLHEMFSPPRVPAFIQAHQVYHWMWDEGAPPPYGQRGTVNTQWPVTVLDVATRPGETLSIPARDAAIYSSDYRAMVLYAAERELTLVYLRIDHVVTPAGAGYVVHVQGLCVDPNLVALYRAQLDPTGRRATRSLPALRNGQPAGTALETAVSVAVRDGGAYLDPRSENDWWHNHP